MFIINIVPKAYENVKKIQNEAVHSNMSDMQIAEKKQINNGQHHYNKCNHRKTKTRPQKHILIFADTKKMLG